MSTSGAPYSLRSFESILRLRLLQRLGLLRLRFSKYRLTAKPYGDGRSSGSETLMTTDLNAAAISIGRSSGCQCPTSSVRSSTG